MIKTFTTTNRLICRRLCRPSHIDIVKKRKPILNGYYDLGLMQELKRENKGTIVQKDISEPDPLLPHIPKRKKNNNIVTLSVHLGVCSPTSQRDKKT